MTHFHDGVACDLAHGTAEAPSDGRALVAVFATPVAEYLLRYAADAGYRTMLIEPDADLAAKVKDGMNGTEVHSGIGTIPDGETDVVVTDHHRDELGVMLRDS